MPAERLRERYVGLLLDRLSQTRYPSGPMLDRIEASLRDEAVAEDYISRLLDTMDQDEYPSPQMIERVNRAIGQLERAQRANRG